MPSFIMGAGASPPPPGKIPHKMFPFPRFSLEGKLKFLLSCLSGTIDCFTNSEDP